MKKQRMGVWVAGATVAAAALLAGCSSDSTTATGGPAATTAPGSTAATGTNSTTAGTTPKGTTKPTGTTPGTGVDATSAFCTQIKAAEAMTKASSGSTQKDEPTQQDIENFTDALTTARDAGPDEVKASLDTLIEAYGNYAKIADDPAVEEKAFDILFNDKVMDADAKLRTVVLKECGFELNVGGSSGSTTNGTSPSPSGLPSDDSPTSVSSVKAAVKAKAGNLSWAPAINEGSWGYSGDGTTYDWTVEASSSGRALNADGAFDACSFIVEYLEPLQPSFSIQIRTSGGTILAEKTESSTTCTKA